MSLATIVLSLKSIIDTIKTRYPELKYVYDENLEYKTSVEKLRMRHLIQSTTSDAFPLFSFRRTVLHPYTYFKRPTNIQMVDLSDPFQGFADLIRTSYGTYDLEFNIYHPDMDWIEAFEVDYLMWQGLKSIREVTVPFPAGLGDFTYQTVWDDLNDLRVNVPEQYYKAVSGTVHVRGWFMSLLAPPEENKVIKEVWLRIRNARGELLSEIDP
jgi:hypothetical protein